MNGIFGIVMVSAAVSTASLSSAATFEISFGGLQKEVIKENAHAASGLDAIYVVDNISEANELKISGPLSSDAKLYEYSSLGGGYAQECGAIFSTGELVLKSPKGNMGYILEQADRRYCFWVVNYSEDRFSVSDVKSSMAQDCDMTRIDIEGNTGQIRYYGINGRQFILDREIKLEYLHLVWDEGMKIYSQQDALQTLEYLPNPLIINPALNCNTTLRIRGDRFLERWGEGVEYESESIRGNGLEVHTFAEQLNLPGEEDSSNMIKGGDDSLLGGSAPAEFDFTSYVSDAVVHNEWQIADDEDFEYVRYRFNEQDLHYTFDKEGTFYVRFVGSNDDGSCETFGETYVIGIGASDLRIPNAFSPDGDGMNDVWKVGYRSLVKFRCTIFDSHGTKIFYFDRPESGWDGTHNGKQVAPGVYYYVIEAEGADGRKYKKGGDINIIRYKKLPNRVPNE